MAQDKGHPYTTEYVQKLATKLVKRAAKGVKDTADFDITRLLNDEGVEWYHESALTDHIRELLRTARIQVTVEFDDDDDGD